MRGKFVVKKGRTGVWTFFWRSANGNLMFQSENYESEQGCLKGVLSAQTNAAVREFYDVHEQKGRFFLTLRNKVGEVLGKSRSYRCRTDVLSARESLIKNLPTGDVLVVEKYKRS